MKKLLLLAPLAFLLAACSHDLTDTERNTARLGALDYAGRDYEVRSVSPQDSDGDGYVSVSLKKPGSPDLQILCAYKGTGAGCKPK